MTNKIILNIIFVSVFQPIMVVNRLDLIRCCFVQAILVLVLTAGQTVRLAALHLPDVLALPHRPHFELLFGGLVHSEFAVRADLLERAVLVDGGAKFQFLELFQLLISLQVDQCFAVLGL